MHGWSLTCSYLAQSCIVEVIPGRLVGGVHHGANEAWRGHKLRQATLWCPPLATMVWGPKACFSLPYGGGGSVCCGCRGMSKAPGHAVATLVLPVGGWVAGGGNGCGGPAAHMFVLRGRTVRCVRAVRKLGCFPPPVATGPRVLNSAPYSPCWYTMVHQGFSFLSLMLATGSRVLNSAPHAVLN